MQVASPDQAQEAHAFVRKWLADNVSAEAARMVRILYGESGAGACSEPKASVTFAWSVSAMARLLSRFGLACEGNGVQASQVSCTALQMLYAVCRWVRD